MLSAVLIALSQAWTDSLGILFSFAILLPAIATVCVIVAIVSGRGDKSQDAKRAGRWGRRPPSDSA